MTDYRKQRSDNHDQPDFEVGEDKLSFTQMATLLEAIQHEEDGSIPEGTSSEILRKIQSGKID